MTTHDLPAYERQAVMEKAFDPRDTNHGHGSRSVSADTEHALREARLTARQAGAF